MSVAGDTSTPQGNISRKLRRSGPSPYLQPLLNSRQRWVYGAGIVLWVLAQIYFWEWWLRPEHVVNVFLFTYMSVAFAWLSSQPLYFLAIFFNATRPASDLTVPTGSRIAMVVTKAPSEPFSVVSKTLEAMLKQDMPHDTWLADEDPSPETRAWCEERGVFISTRKGVADYHRATWPRRTRCKEGNLAYYYDHYGYERYDFVSQLDADHVPAPSYLRHVIAPFADPSVGYVSAPSICDNNSTTSWAARSRLYVEGMIHGAIQCGYNTGWAPLCIGSHYAVRTSALKQIGGLGPELAEDHSTTMMMNGHGWRGVHAFDAIAHGDGPDTFADFATQEFQWARSLIMILLSYSRDYIPMMPARLRFQFLFCQFWYVGFSFFMAGMFFSPLLALATRSSFAAVTFSGFVLHATPAALILMWLFIRFQREGWARPVEARQFSWESTLFLYSRWPWVLYGIFAALRDWVAGSFVDFRVTPKGSRPSEAIPFRVVLPYFVLSMASLLPVIFLDDVGDARGFYFFAMLNAIIYLIILVIILRNHAVENRLSLSRDTLRQCVQFSLALSVCAVAFVSIDLRAKAAIDALSRGTGVRVFREIYPISGAGVSGTNKQILKFDFAWEPAS
ncbi:MAG: cellulose synthase catalytic subunit [Rhizobiaceae bacterium]|nr:cellulose synthase catalytic subunit [Rhizobiaceae bacterium]